jgi:O-antigen ligase
MAFRSAQTENSMGSIDKFKSVFKQPAPAAFVVLFFLLPIGAATVRHWSTTIAYGLILLGVFLCWKKPYTLDKFEKGVIVGFLVFLAVALLSFVNSTDMHLGLKRLGKLVGILGFIPIYLATRRFRLNLSTAFFTGLMLAGPTNMVVALYQTALVGSERAVGAYNPILLSTIAVIAILVGAAALVTNAIDRKYLFPVILSVLCSFYVCILSGSKTSWFTLLLLLPLFGWFVWKRRSSKRIVIIGVSTGVCFMAILLATAGSVQQRMEHFMIGVEDSMEGNTEDLTVGIRIRMWKVALDVWSEHPVFGTGLGDYYVETKNRQENQEVKFTAVPSKAHSIYLESLAVSGIVGLLAMLGALFFLPLRFYRHCWKEAADTKELFPVLSGILCLAVFAFLGVTQSWLSRNYQIIPFVMCQVAFMTACKNRGPTQ